VDALTPKEVPVANLVEYCVSLAREAMKKHEKRFADRIKSIKEASTGLNNTAARFGLAVKNAWGELDKSVIEYGMRLAHTVQEATENIARKNPASTFKEAENFQQESVQALNKIIVTVRKYVPKMHRSLRTEMAALNGALAKLEGATKSLASALDDSPGLKIEALQRDVQLILQRQNELTKLQSEDRQNNDELNSIDLQAKKLQSEIQLLTSEPNFQELKRYEDALTAKEDEIRQFFQAVAKPLLKLERLASTKEDSSIDLRRLRNIVENPVETVTTEQAFASIQLLMSLDDALRSNELGVEDRKRRRAEEAVKLAKEGAMDKMRGEYLTLQANIQETLRQLKSQGLMQQKETLDAMLAETHAMKEKLSKNQNELQRRIDELNGLILKQKRSLESSISKTFHQSASIIAGK
jgi:hypothetical protein